MNYNKVKSEFQIERVINSQSNHSFVDGRLILGNLKIGNYFNASCEYEIKNSILIRKGLKHIDALILDISIYGISVENIEQGLTARIKIDYKLDSDSTQLLLLIL